MQSKPKQSNRPERLCLPNAEFQTSSGLSFAFANIFAHKISPCYTGLVTAPITPPPAITLVVLQLLQLYVDSHPVPIMFRSIWHIDLRRSTAWVHHCLFRQGNTNLCLKVYIFHKLYIFCQKNKKTECLSYICFLKTCIKPTLFCPKNKLRLGSQATGNSQNLLAGCYNHYLT